MGTLIEHVALTRSGWRNRHSALHLAVKAAKDCLRQAGREPHEVDLLINAGIYRDRNLGEPALAAMIQQDIGANPENPHADTHGTFSFDISNGTCGVLTALQIVDGFLQSHAIDCALVVAGDADPGYGMSEHFPFSAAGAAMLCDWTDHDYGLDRISWVNAPDEGESFNATVGLERGHNVLRTVASGEIDEKFAAVAVRAVDESLCTSALQPDDIDVIVAAPARPRYRAGLATRLGVAEKTIIVAEDENAHTASFAAAFERAIHKLPSGSRVLLVAAGAGITAGAGLYRLPAIRT